MLIHQCFPLMAIIHFSGRLSTECSAVSNKMGLEVYPSEVKGPIMDELEVTGFLKNLSGKIFLS